MIIDGVFSSESSQTGTISEKAIATFLKLIEDRLGIKFVTNTRGISNEMRGPLVLAHALREKNIIKDFGKTSSLPDEPPMKSWYAICNDPDARQVGGSTWDSDPNALMATLAEALERYIWLTQSDHFIKPKIATEKEIAKYGKHVPIARFAGFTDEQRQKDAKRELRDDSRYLWVQGKSLVTGSAIYVPAQTVSGLAHDNPGYASPMEPIIRQSTTNGLATWPTKTGARLAGALEVIERDAYMIMWLNQLTLPRISIAALKEYSGVIGHTIEKFDRYRLRPQVIKLLTDAPTHAIAVILEDLSGLSPRFSIGLRAHYSLENAVLKAMTEAARAHRFYRLRQKKSSAWDVHTPTLRVGHRERIDYWGVPEHAKLLEFLIQGNEINIDQQPWDNDGEETHLNRIAQWCISKKYECVAVSLGNSSKNPTPLQIEQVVIPEMQPTYLMDWIQTFGGTRLKEIPIMFGYVPRKKPFDERPHPFS